MKKILLFAAATAVALSSCSKNEEVSVASQDAISFGTFMDRATKATVESEFVATDVFNVDAYYTAGTSIESVGNSGMSAFMQDQTVTASGTESLSWSYSPIKYWPNNDNDLVSFYAVSDATSTVYSFDDLAGTTPSFTVADANTDIMVASILDQKKSSDAINFGFVHTMAQVKFTATTSNTFGTSDATTIKVTSLTVNYGDTKQGGTFTFDNTAANTGAWTLSTSGEAREDDVFKAADGLSNVGIGAALANGTATTIGVPLMVLPSDAASYTVTVVYDVTTTDSVTTANSSTITNTCKFVIAPTAINTIYTYNLAIALTSVDVTGSITANWGSSNTTVTIVDSETTFD